MLIGSNPFGAATGHFSRKVQLLRFMRQLKLSGENEGTGLAKLKLE